MTAVLSTGASRSRWIGWPLFALAACLAMLGAAHAFEAAGYVPCDLCLRQREGYWATAAISAVGVAVSGLRPGLTRAFVLLIGLGFAGEAVLAAYHAGVEWKWWPGPAHCSGRGVGVTTISLDALSKVRAVACDQAAWRMLGLSMAGWNALAAATLAAASFVRAGRLARG